MAAGVLLVVVVGTLAAPLALYLLIKRENSDPEIVDRSEAERLAKKRGGRRGGHHRETGKNTPADGGGHDTRGDGWEHDTRTGDQRGRSGSDSEWGVDAGDDQER